MKPVLFLSSGDVLADRRYDYARALRARGDLDAAADLLMQAVEIAPDFASAWFALGDLRDSQDDHDAAVAAFVEATRADPDDRHGARVRLMRLGAATHSEMPPGYIAALFDQYAPAFEASLVGDLSYRGPQLLRDAVARVCRAQQRPVRFARALDCGCGTGLAARAFADVVDTFAGFDLSPQMVAKARATGLYEALAVGDMVDGLRDTAPASADLVLVADAAIYLPDLAPLCGAAARALTRRGLLALTCETHDGPGVLLGRALRFAHGRDHVEAALAAAGLIPVHLTRESARHEDGLPAPGLVIVGEKV